LNKAWRDKPKQVPSNAEWSRVEAFEAVEAARGRYLDIAECKRLINACDADFRLLVQAALETGARYGEVIRLTVSDFNKDSETIAIRQSKSGKPRHIVLTDEGAKFFHQVCARKPSNASMFIKASGEAWQKSHQQWRMAIACERAKIEPTGFHTLRHTWASLSVMMACH
jgi:integrase